VLPIHTHQFARDRRIGADGRIDSSGERHKITVGCAHDDSRMSWILFVEFHEVPTVERDQAAALIDREPQHRTVGNGLPTKAAFLHGHHVVPQQAQFLRHGERNVFIRVELGHQAEFSGGFVVAYLLLNFGPVGMPVGPRLDQILGTQRRVGAQQVGFAGPEPTGLNEQPHGNARAYDARLTAADIRQGIDPGKAFVKLGDNVSHQPRLLATREAANKIDCLFKGRHSSLSLPAPSLGLSTPRRSG